MTPHEVEAAIIAQANQRIDAVFQDDTDITFNIRMAQAWYIVLDAARRIDRVRGPRRSARIMARIGGGQ